jgi:hypothetical protein
MRQFYTMHENICKEIKACKKINKISLLQKTHKPNKTQLSDKNKA